MIDAEYPGNLESRRFAVEQGVGMTEQLYKTNQELGEVDAELHSLVNTTLRNLDAIANDSSYDRDPGAGDVRGFNNDAVVDNVRIDNNHLRGLLEQNPNMANMKNQVGQFLEGEAENEDAGQVEATVGQVKEIYNDMYSWVYEYRDGVAGSVGNLEVQLQDLYDEAMNLREQYGESSAIVNAYTSQIFTLHQNFHDRYFDKSRQGGTVLDQEDLSTGQFTENLKPLLENPLPSTESETEVEEK